MKKLMIEKFTKENEAEFSKLKKTIPKEFTHLPVQTLLNKKSIFLLIKSGLFRDKSIIGYTIMRDIRGEEFTFDLAEIYKVPKHIFSNHDGIFIEDFYISWRYRKQGIGTWFFKSVIEKYYDNQSLLLVADDNSDDFWKLQGCSYLDEEQKVMIKV